MRKILIAKLDKLVSQFVRNKNPQCVTCGYKSELCNGHIFHRRNLATRFDIWDGGNCYTQCYLCNSLHEINCTLFKEWYIKRWGSGMLSELKRRHNKIVKIKDFQLEELCRMLQSGEEENYKNFILSL